jgi:hypothetical protein
LEAPADISPVPPVPRAVPALRRAAAAASASASRAALAAPDFASERSWSGRPPRTRTGRCPGEDWRRRG